MANDRLDLIRSLSKSHVSSLTKEEGEEIIRKLRGGGTTLAALKAALHIKSNIQQVLGAWAVVHATLPEEGA